MNDHKEAQTDVVFRGFIVIAIVTIVARAFYFIDEPLGWTAAADNDDMIRLLSIRDWLEGQSWFDMRQYRILPPEGLDMHWSRYIDAAIAGLIALFGAFLPYAQAENLALVTWPTLLLAAHVLLTGEVARRVFGTSAAILTIMSVMLWPPVGLGNFAPYRIDHHNVQILLISVVVFSLILPGRSPLLGFAGGLAAALSLAIGMEMLLVIALAGVILALGTVLQAPWATERLPGFGIALFAGSVVLFAGQTAPDAWGLAQCDKLSPPYLALTGVAALAAVALARVVAPIPSLRSRAILFLAIGAASGAALYPILAPCLEGPYAALPPEAQAFIHGRIREALGLLTAISRGTDTPYRLFLPAFIGVIIAATVFTLRVRRGQASADEKRAVGILLAFAALGLLGSFSQIRMVLLAAPAVTLLTGYGLAMMLVSDGRPGPASAWRSVGLIAAMLATIFLPLIDTAVKEARAAPSGDIETVGCRSKTAISTLAALPTGSVLAPGDFGSPLALFTPHAVLAVPFHRSAEAFLNGFVPFDRDEATLREAMDRTGADYLLLCRDTATVIPNTQAHRLVTGAEPDWLERVPGVHPELLVLRPRAE
jgi:hypothetical protein